MKNKNFSLSLVVLLLTLSFTSCKKDDPEPPPRKQVTVIDRIELTDAQIEVDTEDQSMIVTALTTLPVTLPGRVKKIRCIKQDSKTGWTDYYTVNGKVVIASNNERIPANMQDWPAAYPLY